MLWICNSRPWGYKKYFCIFHNIRILSLIVFTLFLSFYEEITHSPWGGVGIFFCMNGLCCDPAAYLSLEL